jgi:thiol:disulfide interchange protein DsbD
MALNLTPCIYPMIPITVSYFGGRATGSKQQQGSLLIHGLAYLFGLAAAYSSLGVIASLTGGLMGGLLRNTAVLVAVALILACFATSLFGLWEIRLPAGLTRAASKSHKGYFGSLFMGLTLGIVAAPCLGPFVLGILTWVASMGNPLAGFLIFFILSLGLGLPLFFLALFSGQLKHLPRSGGWMIWIRCLMGWVLLVMAAYYMGLVLSGLWATLLMAVVVAAAGVHLGWIDKSRSGGQLFPWIKTLAGAGCLVWSASVLTLYAMQGPGISWESYSDKTLEAAKTDGKPVIIDFSAKWCAPCRELDDVTFRDRMVSMMAEREFVFIRVDVSRAGDPLNERLLREYSIKGVPSVLFLDPEGNEKTELRLVDYLPPDDFLLRMVELKKK